MSSTNRVTRLRYPSRTIIHFRTCVQYKTQINECNQLVGTGHVYFYIYAHSLVFNKRERPVENIELSSTGQGRMPFFEVKHI